jgi:Arc/MetJ-type ribon-helix-helix transcriptional regulator
LYELRRQCANAHAAAASIRSGAWRPTRGGVSSIRSSDRVMLPEPWYDCMSYQEQATMPKTKLAVTLNADLVEELDQLVADHHFPNRSQAIETAVAEKIKRLSKTRLARECAKLDPKEERALAEEGLAGSRDTWPEY